MGRRYPVKTVSEKIFAGSMRMGEASVHQGPRRAILSHS
jgi:hypothetical protein